jgi:hypothetical protein
MSTYSEYTTESGTTFIQRQDEDGRIYTFPTDLSNSDYQRYLEEQANDQSL